MNTTTFISFRQLAFILGIACAVFFSGVKSATAATTQKPPPPPVGPVLKAVTNPGLRLTRAQWSEVTKISKKYRETLESNKKALDTAVWLLIAYERSTAFSDTDATTEGSKYLSYLSAVHDAQDNAYTAEVIVAAEIYNTVLTTEQQSKLATQYPDPEAN